MSKNPLTSVSNENLLRSSSSNESKAFLPRSSKHKKIDELKCPLKSSITPKTSLNSPSIPRLKMGYSWVNLKTVIEKSPNSAIISAENAEIKENCSFETRLFSSPKKENKRNFASLYKDKSLSILSKLNTANGQPRTSQPKSPMDIYEGTSNKKLKKTEGGNQTSTSIIEKDNRMSLLAEPSKKSSLPMNLKLTLEKICGKGESSTHRIHLSPSSSESSTKFLPYKPKKSSRALGTESRNGQNETNKSDSKAKCKLNTLLTGLNKPLAELNKNPGKFSFREVHSVNATPRQCSKEAYSVIERGPGIKKFNGILGMLKEKNDEYKRLSQTKAELQSALTNEEIRNIYESQNSFRERGASYNDLKNSLSQKHLVLEDSKIQSPSSNFMKSAYLYQKDRESTEIKTPKMLLTSGGKNEFKCYSDRSGKSWITAITNSKAVKVSERETSVEKQNEVSSKYEKAAYLKARHEEFRKEKYRNHANTQRSVERDTALVNEETLKRRISYDNNLEETKPNIKEELNIGQALSQLKDRIERLLKAKSKEDSMKTNLIYQSLREQFPKVIE